MFDDIAAMVPDNPYLLLTPGPLSTSREVRPSLRSSPKPGLSVLSSSFFAPLRSDEGHLNRFPRGDDAKHGAVNR